MSFRKSVLALALAVPLGAAAENQEQLVKRYTSFAGSQENAASLVAGLRDGKQVTLTGGGTTETFAPPTRKMGYGNVDHALALAAASLKKEGITQPTPAQLEAAVMDVLRLRAEGRGWGQIADAKGFKLGEVKRAEARPEAAAAQSERLVQAERPARPERPEKPERPDKPERHGRR